MNIEAYTAENWGYPPYNRRSFQHVQSLFPTTRIRRGDGPASELRDSAQNVGSLEYTSSEGQLRCINDMLNDTYTDAFIVLKNGIILAEEYRNDMGPDSFHLLNSVTKSFVGVLTGILVEDGLLEPNEKVASYVPEFAATAFRDTTLQTALDMTAAVKFGEDYADRQADFWVETAVVGWRPALVHSQLAKTLFDHACSMVEVEQAEGEHFHYRTILTNVIAMVIERVTGRRIQNLLEERLWQKLGPEQDAAIVVDPSGFPYVGAGMNACARDLARFGQMLLGNGEYNGEQIVPASWVQKTVNGDEKLRALFAASDYAELIPGGHYHNQVWANAEQGVMMCIGIHGQTIHINQKTGVVSVKFSTHPDSADMAIFGDTFLALNALSVAI